MRLFLAVLAAWFLTTASANAADVLILTNGERLVGQLLNPTESPRKQYVFQPAEGERVTLDASAVRKVAHIKPEELEYERIRPHYADTAAGQWELAEWCRSHQLKSQRETHLRRVVELDPDNADAHRALGEIKIGGRWTSPDEDRRRNGYVFYKGRWVTTKEVEVLKEKKEAEAAQIAWMQKVKRWRGWIGSSRESEAIHNFRSISDPTAVKALSYALQEDGNRETRLTCAEVLGKIDTHDAAGALANGAIFDDDKDVRQLCIEILQAKKRPNIVTYFTVQLKHKNNAIVNNAGYCLGKMKDPTATKPLIDALITTHKHKLPPTGDMSVGFGGGGGNSGGGMNVGQKPTMAKTDYPNQAVLDALVAITGKNFGFDKREWRAWYADQKRTVGEVNTRRD
jgi:hypothetical protein